MPRVKVIRRTRLTRPQIALGFLLVAGGLVIPYVLLSRPWISRAPVEEQGAVVQRLVTGYPNKQGASYDVAVVLTDGTAGIAEVGTPYPPGTRLRLRYARTHSERLVVYQCIRTEPPSGQ